MPYRPLGHAIATDTDRSDSAMARNTVQANGLTEFARVVHASDDALVLDPIAWNDWIPDVVVCNPSFFDVVQPRETTACTSGQTRTDGGEVEFVKQMVRESVNIPQVQVFTSLIGVHADVQQAIEFLRSKGIHSKDVVNVCLQRGTGRSRWAVALRFEPLETIGYVVEEEFRTEYEATLRITPRKRNSNR